MWSPKLFKPRSDFILDPPLLYTVTSEERNTPKARIKINNVAVEMIVDTGASIDIIDQPNFEALQKSARIVLQKSKHAFSPMELQMTSMYVGNLKQPSSQKQKLQYPPFMLLMDIMVAC